LNYFFSSLRSFHLKDSFVAPFDWMKGGVENYKTHQFIPLKPAGKGRNERYTSTVIIFSMEYFEWLKKNS